MQLSQSAQTALQRAARDFAAEVLSIVQNEHGVDLAAELHRRLDELTGGASATPHPRRKRARRTRQGATNGVEKLVAIIRDAGGTVIPGVVSKALGLSPEARRRLVAKAVEAGLVRTKGVRRGTVYALA